MHIGGTCQRENVRRNPRHYSLSTSRRIDIMNAPYPTIRVKEPMATIESLRGRYRNLDRIHEEKTNAAIDRDCLLAFDYEYAGADSEVVIEMNEFTAECPWTGLPDFGSLEVRYIPDRLCIELKSLKYYLLSYSGVHIVQEHAANRILNDLVGVCQPVRMTVILDYNVRGGLHTTVTVKYEKDA